MLVFLFFGLNGCFAQEDSIPKQEVIDMKLKTTESVKEKDFGLDLYDPLGPAKAAFFSAVIPGLGQAYNGRYWKIPLVYAAIGTTTYFYIDNTKQYNTYRNAFKQRLTGQQDEFAGILTDQNLIDAQKLFRKNRDLSLLFVFGAYILNIVDANVDAHLQQFNVSENLSFKPRTEQNFFTGELTYGVSLNFKFN
jgi:TM2 domain-containing membrane protein YozV